MPEIAACFITPARAFDRAPLLRTERALATGHGAVVRATAFVSALGVVEAFLNGAAISDDVLTPGWTSYEWRVRFAEHDVTRAVADVADGRIALGLALGDGWYRGRLGWGGTRRYGDELAGMLILQVEFSDGYEEVFRTDESWRAAPGPTTSDSLYDGQSVDARLAPDDWTAVGFDDGAWSGVRTIPVAAALEPPLGPPVRRQQELRPISMTAMSGDRVLVDFGQNLVGWVRLAVRGRPGEVVTLRHAEVLEDGEPSIRPLRSALATDRYTLSGGDDVFEPTFTFHGFRYVEVTGWPGGLAAMSPHALTAVVVHSDLRRLGRLRTSDPLLNRLHENVVWGMRGNFLAIPTDCPQRDERLGWTGDIAVFAPSAAFLYDVDGFLRDWLRDLALEQRYRGGIVPLVVPDVLTPVGQPEGVGPLQSTAIWSDAAVWVPWALWEAYGDPGVLSDAFESMVAHVRHVRGLLSPSGVWDRGFQFGDWLDPDAPADEPGAAKADKGVVATASFHRSADLVARAAAVLGRGEEAEEFAALAADVRRAFHREYVADERIRSDCPTVYALAIVFGLLDAHDRAWAGHRLAQLVVRGGARISTGFAGTPFLLDALTSTGHRREAFALLLQRECPSWLYPVTMGATTIWERWDSLLPDGSVNPGSMTSFNHYALGAVADWMHRVLGGLSPAEPGYSRLLIDPLPGGGITWAETSLETPHGLARVHWTVDGRVLHLEVTIPVGTTAVVRDRAGEDIVLGEGTHVLDLAHDPG